MCLLLQETIDILRIIYSRCCYNALIQNSPDQLFLHSVHCMNTCLSTLKPDGICSRNSHGTLVGGHASNQQLVEKARGMQRAEKSSYIIVCCYNYLCQKVLRSVVFVCLLVCSFVLGVCLLTFLGTNISKTVGDRG